MKRILVYGLSSTMGGTENYLLNLYKAIDTRILQFDFLFEHSVEDIPYEEEITSRGGKIYKGYYRNSERNLPGAISIKNFLSEHPEWDGIYINIQNINTAYRLITAAKKLKIKYRVIHAHSNNYSRKPSIKDKIYEVYFHLTKVFNVTDFLACSELAGKFAFNNSFFKVIPNAVDFGKFAFCSEKRAEMREKFNIADNIKVIGFCGRLVYQKNVHFLLQIFEKLYERDPDTCLLLVGDGEQRVELEQVVNGKEFKDNVIFTGSVTNIEDYMQMMDCFVLPSLFEGFGIVLLEAQASGLQCFASKSVVPESTNIGGNVEFISLDLKPEFWANVILKCNFERIDCTRKLLESEHTISKSLDKIINIFNK